MTLKVFDYVVLVAGLAIIVLALAAHDPQARPAPTPTIISESALVRIARLESMHLGRQCLAKAQARFPDANIDVLIDIAFACSLLTEATK